MSLTHFTVSQIRTAATCPRIHYFDVAAAREKGLAAPRSTLVWVRGSKARVAGGALFHNVVERFNRKAAKAPEVLAAVESSQGDVELGQALLRFVNENCINLEKFSERSVPLRQAFVVALQGYFEELASIANYAVSNRVTPAQTVQQLFGDARRRVDVTFHVGADDQAHVTGAIDYVFYDWRFPGHRIVDYKLTPHEHANRDLFQVCSYALMHHAQHGSSPGVALFYLHPKRRTVGMSWARLFAERAKVYNLIASMVSWSAYDERCGQGLKPPGDVTWCSACKWNKQGQCEERLGPKAEGHLDSRWRELESNAPPEEPGVTVNNTPPMSDEDEASIAEVELEGLDEPEEEGETARVQGSVPASEIAVHYAVTLPVAMDGGAPETGVTTSAGTERANARVGEGTVESTPIAKSTDGAGSGERRPEAIVPGRVPPWDVQPDPEDQELPKLGSRLHLGAFERGGAPLLLDPKLINTHVAVVGAAGSGKTWTAKVFAEEVVAAGVPVIAVDPQGDLVQFLHGYETSGLDYLGQARQRLYRQRVEPRIFTPGTSHGIRLSLNPIRLASSEDLRRIQEPTRRQEEEETVLNAVASNLVSLAGVGGEQEAQRTFLYLLLRAMPRGANVQLADVVAAILDPEARGVDEPDRIVKKTDREKLGRKLNSYVLGPARNLFTGGFPLDIDRLIQPSEPGKVPLNVIYLNALIDDEQKHFFLASLAAEIYRWMVTSLDATTGQPNLLFYLDEARDFIPAGGSKPPAKEPLIRLFTQGRKYGVGCLLCTQSPRSVDYNVFGNCSTKIVGRMEAAQDIERIADWFTLSGAAPSWVAERKGAEKGSFVGRWPGITAAEEGKVFKGRPLYSVHEGAWSPDRVEREVDASGLRERLKG